MLLLQHPDNDLRTVYMGVTAHSTPASIVTPHPPCPCTLLATVTLTIETTMSQVSGLPVAGRDTGHSSNVQMSCWCPSIDEGELLLNVTVTNFVGTF